jgi:hypothetical protein
MTWSLRIAACGAFAATALVRYLALEGFNNDHFLFLAGAQQVLAGEWPGRDFADPGMPLMYLASAGAQLLLGRTLFAEAVLVSIAYGLAAALTLVAAHRLSRSLLVAIAATALSVAIFPLSYSYPKLLVYAGGVLLAWAWHDAPSLPRMFWLAAIVVVAFLFRHDHGVYLGTMALATIALETRSGARQALSRAVAFCALVALLVAPYLAYVQWYDGLADHFTEGIEFSRREADRSRLHLGASRWTEARLYYGFHVLPLAALAWLAASIRQSSTVNRQYENGPIVAPLACLAILVDRGFLRDPLFTRLPDVIVPAVLLTAWLAGRALRLQGNRTRLVALSCVTALVTVGAHDIVAVGRTREQLGRTYLSLGPGRLPAVIAQKTDELRARFSPRQVPDGRLPPLIPLFAYLDRCTTRHHRLFVTGFAPEVFVYAGRLFAGGQSTFVEGYSRSADSERRILARLERQTVALVLMPIDAYSAWRKDFPRLDRFVDSHFRPLVDVETPGRTMRVLVNTGLPPLGTDSATKWPCYVPN